MKRGLLIVTVMLLAGQARATGFTDLGQDIAPRRGTGITLDGSLRTRGEALWNLDLDRGLTPSGQALFPTPLGDPGSQLLTHADMRLRTDLSIYAPGGGVAVKVRMDVLDNVTQGSTAEGIPSASSTQTSPDAPIRIRRAYGEALTPFGLVVAGRVGSQWGLGMLANGGDCADCDSGDSADRVAFITPLAGLIWAVAFDISASGPVGARKDGARGIDLGRSDDVHSVTLAVLSWRNDRARRRRARAGKSTFEWGAYFSHRWQSDDVPADYLPVAQPRMTFSAADVMARGFRATALDGWARLTTPRLRIEAEAALLIATVDQPSLIPGVLLDGPVRSTQIGAALESEYGRAQDRFSAGLDLGFASGDPAPGFGAFPQVGAAAPQPGDLDGAQASPPGDLRVDNFRFHPDYRIDRILFHEIIGTVTDAFYARPHARVTLLRGGPGELRAAAAAIASFAVEPTSTPGNARPLGVELDPTLLYESRDGFQIAFEYALLVPLAGLDGSAQSATVAQLARLRLGYLF